MTRLLRSLSVAIGLCGAGVASSGWAQSAVAIRQAPSPAEERSNSVDASQVGPAGISTAPMDVGPGERAVGGSLPSATPSLATLQIAPGTASAESGPQLAPTESSPVPSALPQSLAQGRITTVTTPQGSDRCDPQSRRPAPSSCAVVIESRAQDFAAADPRPLSAEQELLARQRDQRTPSLDIGTAARRLGNGQIDETTAGVIVAAQSMQALQPAAEEPADTDASALDAIVAGITTLVTGQPPTP